MEFSKSAPKKEFKIKYIHKIIIIYKKLLFFISFKKILFKIEKNKKDMMIKIKLISITKLPTMIEIGNIEKINIK